MEITDLISFPKLYYQMFLNKEMFNKIIGFIPLGTTKEIAKLCNVSVKYVEQVLTGLEQDDLILQVTLSLFEKRFEEYYGEKPALINLSYLFQDKS